MSDELDVYDVNTRDNVPRDNQPSNVSLTPPAGIAVERLRAIHDHVSDNPRLQEDLMSVIETIVSLDDAMVNFAEEAERSQRDAEARQKTLERRIRMVLFELSKHDPERAQALAAMDGPVKLMGAVMPGMPNPVLKKEHSRTQQVWKEAK